MGAKAAVAAPGKISDKAVRQQLARILTSKTFSQVDRLKRFVDFVVSETVAGHGSDLKEYVIGVQVFGKEASFDRSRGLMPTSSRSSAVTTPALADNLADAAAAGLPPINVSPNQGRLLYLLAKIAGARRILEIGTLGGYSTTWLARALPPSGLVVSLELNHRHAAVARSNLDRAALAARVEVRVGPAADSPRRMTAANEAPFDFVFIDADKPGYVRYLELVLPLSHPGTVIVADNVVRNGLVLDATPADDNAKAAREFNATVAAHPRLESIILPIVRTAIDGMSISIVR